MDRRQASLALRGVAAIATAVFIILAFIGTTSVALFLSYGAGLLVCVVLYKLGDRMDP